MFGAVLGDIIGSAYEFDAFSITVDIFSVSAFILPDAGP